MRRIICGICLMLIVGAVCGARQTSHTDGSSPELDSFAAQIAQQIEKKHLKSVVVIGAVGRDASKLTQDGKGIGDEISTALTKRANGFQVLDREAFRDFLKKNGISEAMAVSDALASWTARISQVAGYVVIQIAEVSNGKVKIAANLYRVDLGDVTPLGTLKTELELTDEQKRVGFRPLDSDWNKWTISTDDAKKLPPDRSPKCSPCLGPHFPDSFRNSAGRNADLTVGLFVTVFPDGKLGDIAVVKQGPFGMTEFVVQDVLQNWHFRPALDVEGKPIAFRTMIEVRFQTR